ncbi:MAG TPA: TrkA family potassium uptake protein [Anaerolineaceae bacterium]|nr:TrkA family potassium uptake protein [Anaerolineaceae bacterium]
MKVLIVGCGRLGSDLASRLSKMGHEVSVIDNTAAAFSNLPSDFQGRVIEGDALNRDVLYRAGIEQSDAVAAVTNMDALNAVVAHIAHEVYDVNNVVVRNYDPHSRPMHESFGLQVVSSTSWGAQRIEEMLYHAEIRTVFSAGNGEVELYEVRISEAWEGKRISDLLRAEDAVATSVTRAGRAFLPAVDTQLQEGDLVGVSATLEGITDIRARLDTVKEA